MTEGGETDPEIAVVGATEAEAPVRADADGVMNRRPAKREAARVPAGV